jgi:DHA3 family tetracycline resistance protein-like MFS transporter
MTRRLPVVTVYLAYMALDGFLFRVMSVIFSVFLILRLGLGPFQLVVMGTILEGSYLLFETPTGIVADTISRRTSVIIGLAGGGVGFLILGFSPGFWMAAASQVVWGIFATFQSGADVAWLTDEVGEEAARSLYIRGSQFAHVAMVAGIIVGVALGTVNLALPIVVSGVGLLLLALGLWIVMPEDNFQRRARAEGERLHRSLIETFKEAMRAVRAHHVLMLILGTAALHGASTEGFDRLADLHLLRDIGLPSIGNLSRLWWFAILDAGALLIGFGSLAILHRRLNLEGHVAVARILALIDMLLVASVVVFAVTGELWVAIAAAWVVGALRSVRDPVFTAWINQGLDPKTRATVNSIGGQADAVGQAAGGPVLGGIAGGIGVPFAIVVSGLIRLPTLLLYRRAIKRGSVGTLAADQIQPALRLDDDPVP